jgi:HAD superfamily hydrolase (TIGR01509 family)
VTLSTSSFAAVIFDMDGVLVDGEPLHFHALNELLAAEGRHVTLDEYRPYMGTKAGWTEFIADLGLAHDRDYYAPRYDELILRQYRENAVALPGAVELVRALRRAGLPVGLASSSAAGWVDACLAKLGLTGAFDAVVTGSDVREGKPHPEIYLVAAARLRVAPSSCLAIEDAPAGIESAHAAGMTCWAVRTPYTAGLTLPGPDREFASLRDVDLGEIVSRAA